MNPEIPARWQTVDELVDELFIAFLSQPEVVFNELENEVCEDIALFEQSIADNLALYSLHDVLKRAIVCVVKFRDRQDHVSY